MKTFGAKSESIIMMAAFTAILATPGGGLAAEGRFERTLKVAGPVELAVRTGSGHINVSTGDSSTVEVRGTIKAQEGALSGGDGQKRVQYLEAHPPLEQNGNIIKIGQTTDPDLQRNISISYDLVVPPETRLKSGSGSGSITVEGIAGPLDASTGSGAITATDLGGDVRASAGSGEIEVRSVRGSVRASTGSGPIHASGVAGSFRAATGSGSIEASEVAGGLSPTVYSRLFYNRRQIGGGQSSSVTPESGGAPQSPTASGEVKASTGSGSIRLEHAGGVIHASSASGPIQVASDAMAGTFSLETASGNITVQLPPSAGFEVRAQTVSGAVTTDRPMAVQTAAGRHGISGKSGDGAVLLELETVSGNIQIH